MSKKTADQGDDALLGGKRDYDNDEGDFADPKLAQAKQKVDDSPEEGEESELKVPDKLNICQWIVVAILYLVFAFLVGFIIYISSTWNKDRTNEYT